jgi:hypothetical protein
MGNLLIVRNFNQSGLCPATTFMIISFAVSAVFIEKYPHFYGTYLTHAIMNIHYHSTAHSKINQR